MTALNKNGQPRKSGSGRTKGATSLVSIKLSELQKHFTDEEMIVCGRVFLAKAGINPDGPAIAAPLTAEEKAGIKVIDI